MRMPFGSSSMPYIRSRPWLVQANFPIDVRHDTARIFRAARDFDPIHRTARTIAKRSDEDDLVTPKSGSLRFDATARAARLRTNLKLNFRRSLSGESALRNSPRRGPDLSPRDIRRLPRTSTLIAVSAADHPGMLLFLLIAGGVRLFETHPVFGVGRVSFLVFQLLYYRAVAPGIREASQAALDITVVERLALPGRW